MDNYIQMISNKTLDFFNKNKDCTWTMPVVPKDLLGSGDNFAISRWLLNNPQFGWLKLDLEFNLDVWKQEAEHAIGKFVSHRDDESSGWNSCCIHGIDVDKTGAWTTYGYTNEDDVPYKWTALSEQTPSIKNFWNNTFPSEKYRRIRFMEVEANGEVAPHSDMPGKLPGEENFDPLDFGVPVNIALVHPEDCHMILEGFGILPWKEGEAYVINIRHYHAVANFSNVPRIHMIGHGMFGNRKKDFADLIVRSYKKFHEHN